jgi:hypothetical protein
MKGSPVWLCMAVVLFAGRARAEDVCVDSYVHSQEVRLEKRLVRARELFAKCAANTCPAAIRKDCSAWLKEVDQALASVVVVPRDPNGLDAPHATVTVDGSSAAASTSFPIDPGRHRIRCERAGSASVDLDVTIQEGEKNRVIACVLAPEAPKETVSKPAVPLGTWISGGAGLVLIGIGAGFAASGVADRNAMIKSGCAKAGDCSESAVTTVRIKLGVADATITTGIAGLGVAVLVYFLQRPKTPDPAAAVATPTVTLMHLPGGGVLGLHGTF